MRTTSDIHSMRERLQQLLITSSADLNHPQAARIQSIDQCHGVPVRPLAGFPVDESNQLEVPHQALQHHKCLVGCHGQTVTACYLNDRQMSVGL
jgi:hypothetical protein